MKKLRKILLIVLSMSVILSFAACGKSDSNSADNKKSKENVETTGDKNNIDEDKKEDSKDKKQEKNINEEKEITLYFSDDQAQYLVGEVRKLENPTVKSVIEELIKGPKSSNLYKTLPKETKVIDVKVKDKVASVNFTKDLSKKLNNSSAGANMALYSIVNTLTLSDEFNIDKVQILIEGEKVDILGPLDVSIPFEANKNIMKK